MRNIVFISYAREDREVAERLYMDLRKNDINAWLDTKCLLPGQNWRKEISNVIRECAYFVALISQNSLNKRGFVQKEVKIAFEVLDEIPTNQIFLIPVKLDNTQPYDDELRNLNWVDFSISYKKGIDRILAVIADIDKEPLELRGTASLVGKRAPIEFTPFKSYEEFIRNFIGKLPESDIFFDQDYDFYIRYKTTFDGVIIPDYLLKQYPDEMKIVMQHQFENVEMFQDYFEIGLFFNRKKETLRIPYAAVVEIFSFSLGLSLGRIERNIHEKKSFFKFWK